MKKTLALFLSLLLSSSLYAMTKKQSSSENQIDDWDYNATIETHPKKSRSIVRKMTMSAAPVAMEASLGFSVGGAKDADNFYENIKQGYLPKIEAMTYEGVFYDHSFESAKQESCETLFCPSYSTAISKNPFTDEKEYYLSVGLDSNIKESDFKRKRLNIVVVLDISGSMSSPFNQYYYDKNRRIESKDNRIKMTLANEAIVSMSEHLNDDDTLGVVLFDNQAYNAKPLRPIKDTNMDAIKKHILDLKPRGGTNWSAGYKAGVALFETLEGGLKDPKLYENRIIFLTDAMPNRGELNKEGLFSIAKNASAKNIHTTFIGIGVDFNNDLVEAVSKTKGANYYAIHSSKEFKKRLDEEFDYMVTPLVFDLKLSLDSNAYKIIAVYGSPEANLATGELMRVNTLFPSPSSEEGTRGGVILLKLKKRYPSNDNLSLSVSYHDRVGKAYTSTKTATFKEGLYHDNSSTQKAILLSSYVDLMKNFSLDMRKGCNDKMTYPPFISLKRTCGIYPPNRDIYPSIKTWERKSCPLLVSEGYKKIFSLYSKYFKNQMKEIGDESLSKELALLDTLTSDKNHQSGKVDDWKGIKR